MRIQTIDAGIWWIAFADEIRPRDGAVMRNLIIKLQEIFKFAQVPTQLPQPGGLPGLDFLEGSFEADGEQHPITKLAIYQDGLNITVPGNTQRAEKALQRTLDFFLSLGYREPTSEPIRYFISTIVVDFDRPIDHLFSSAILRKIADVMSIRGASSLMSFRTGFDPATIPSRLGSINPTQFLIERRVAVPFETNRYFCQANTTTELHIKILDEIERLA